MSKIFTFFKEVKLEVKKVNWPTRQETKRYTIVVIAFSLVLAAYLGAVDYIFSTLLNMFVFK